MADYSNSYRVAKVVENCNMNFVEDSFIFDTDYMEVVDNLFGFAVLVQGNMDLNRLSSCLSNTDANNFCIHYCCY